VSNVHTAERVVECAPGFFVSEAPWRIELPQGGVIRGGPSSVGSWPAAFDGLPANRRIVRSGASGPGKVLEDNGTSIDASLAEYSGSVTMPTPRPEGSAGSPGGAGKGSGNDTPNEASSGAAGASNGAAPASASGGGCSFTGAPSGAAELLLAGALGLTLARRRRQR
jgi:hypothetical protein